MLMNKHSKEMFDQHCKNVKDAKQNMEECLKNYNEGLITPWELSNRMIEQATKIQGECAVIGAWTISWGGSIG